MLWSAVAVGLALFTAVYPHKAFVLCVCVVYLLCVRLVCCPLILIIGDSFAKVNRIFIRFHSCIKFDIFDIMAHNLIRIMKIHLKITLLQRR